MYYDYAETILDPENLAKFTGFVDQVFSLKKIGTVYFCGDGGNGMSTLIDKMISNYPSIFGFEGSGARVTIYQESPYPGRLPAKGENSVIIVSNQLPDGVYPSRIVFFNKKF